MLKEVALVLLLCAKDEGKREKKAWAERVMACVTQEDVKDSVR